jgi:membrane dipeptidase
MNEAGMAIDVSHCGPRTTLDALEASCRPVLITHSNCAALVPGQRRCKSDEVIYRMARNGGVIGITGIRAFVRRGEPVHVSHLVDHFEHVARLVGIEHAGLGCDTDVDVGGRSVIPDATKRVFDLTEELIRRGFSDHSIGLLLGGNFLRALRQIWDRSLAVAACG